MHKQKNAHLDYALESSKLEGFVIILLFAFSKTEKLPDPPLTQGSGAPLFKLVKIRKKIVFFKTS